MLPTTSSTVSNSSINCIPKCQTFQNVSSVSKSNLLSNLGNLQHLRISTSLELHKKNRYKYMAINSGVDPAPLDPLSVPWKWWIAGMVFTTILSFWKNKSRPLNKLKERVESMEEKAEELANATEKVAEEVEKVADEAADCLPEGGKLQKAAIFVEDCAKQTARDAHLVSQIIDQVEEAEKEVESLIESAMDDANDISKETKDQPN